MKSGITQEFSGMGNYYRETSRMSVAFWMDYVLFPENFPHRFRMVWV